MKASSYRSKIGLWGELCAAKYYKKLGFKVLDKNVFNKHGKRLGELDIIVSSRTHLLFIEVKTRSDQVQKYGSGFEAVNLSKQKKLVRIVQWFLQQNPELSKLIPQIDVCVVEYSKLDRTLKNVIIQSNAVLID